MKAVEIESCIRNALTGSDVLVETDDEHHFFATVVWNGFEGMAPVARQRTVYAALGDAFSTGAVHALALKTKTPQE
jgi:acid stress-induced BolA-like protein IbaG/YrbA